MIPVQKVLVRYTVTAGVLEYAVPFALYGTGDVNVSWAAAGDTETQTTLAPGSDYSVTVFRDMTGGKVTLADGKVPAGATLAIESAVPLTQELDLSNTATVDTEATEGQLDRMVQMIQQLDDGLSRAVKVNATDSGTPEDLLASLYRARDDAQGAATAAAASEQAAEGSEQAAATSASRAAASEQAAATSAEAADQSRAEAAASAAAASQSAMAASQSAEAAAESESKAAGSAASILGLQVEVSTLNPGLPAGGDYDPETGILHLGIPKGDSGASAIATPTSLGSVMPKTGDEDGLVLGADGALSVRAASATQRGSVLASETAQAGTVPTADGNGRLDESWLKAAMLPVGTLIPSFATSMAGCLLGNGAAVSRTTYKELFALFGTKFGAGDGSTTFNLPDFRDRTLWGANGNLMEAIAAGLPDAKGGFTVQANSWSGAQSVLDFSGVFKESGGRISGTYPEVAGRSAKFSQKYTLSLSNYNDIYGKSNTVQPPSIGVNIFIKY